MEESDALKRNHLRQDKESELIWNLSFKAEDYFAKSKNYAFRAEEYLAFVKGYQLITSIVHAARNTRSAKRREDNMVVAGVLYQLVHSIEVINKEDPLIEEAMGCLRNNYQDFFNFMEAGRMMRKKVDESEEAKARKVFGKRADILRDMALAAPLSPKADDKFRRTYQRLRLMADSGVYRTCLGMSVILDTIKSVYEQKQHERIE
ncbi:MAG: hypothetical protein AABX17_01980 [Nanoarchaeota archaeon]